MARAALVVYEDNRSRWRTDRIVGVVLEHPTGASVEWRFGRTPPPRSVAFRTRATALNEIESLNHWWIRVPALDLYGFPPEGFPAQAGFVHNQFVTPREWMVRRGAGDYGDSALTFVADDSTISTLYADITTGTGDFTEPAPADIPERSLVTNLYRPGVADPPAVAPPGEVGGFLLAHAEATVEMLMDGIVGFSIEPTGEFREGTGERIESMIPIRANVRLRDVLPDRGDREAAVSEITDRMLGR